MVVPLKDKQGMTITYAFQKNLHESGLKPTKSSKFQNRSMKSWLHIEMYSAHSEGKSVVAERFIRNLKIKV